MNCGSRWELVRLPSIGVVVALVVIVVGVVVFKVVEVGVLIEVLLLVVFVVKVSRGSWRDLKYLT